MILINEWCDQMMENMNSFLEEKTEFHVSHKRKVIALVIFATIAIISMVSILIYNNTYAHTGTYNCVNDGAASEKVVLYKDGTYTKTGEGKGTYRISEHRVDFTPENGEKSETLLRVGNYLYSQHGWYDDDSPYFTQKISKGEKLDQVLSFVSNGSVNTLAGRFYISIERNLELKKDGTYIYTYESNNNGTKHKTIESGKYNRTNKELQLKEDNGNNRIMPIVDNKVVYVTVYKK